MRQPRVLDNDREHALASLINVDRAGIGNRRTQTDWKSGHLEPARFVLLNAFFVPFLASDFVISAFKPALLEFDVADDHFILVDAAFDDAVDFPDLHHFEAEIAELVRGEKRTVRPAECGPGNARLRLQLRKKNKLSFVGFAGVQHMLDK